MTCFAGHAFFGGKMTLKEFVLKELRENDGKYISGQELAEKSGKSRAAVWKAVKALKKDGFSVLAVTNRGYALDSESDVLTENRIKAAMRHDIKIICLDETDSTNSYAKRIAGDSDCGALLITADRQTAGRGRQGKHFYSPAGTGIYMSLVVHPNSLLQSAVSATTAAAVAVCRAIERLSDIRPQIKWVNDVYCGGSKVCGILTEAVSDFELGIVTSVIIGIGINISTADFPAEAGNAGSLNADIRRADLIAATADELLDIVFGDYADFIEYYRSHSMLLGKKISFMQGGKITPATAVAIDEKGGLVVETEDGARQTLRSGEISISW